MYQTRSTCHVHVSLDDNKVGRGCLKGKVKIVGKCSCKPSYSKHPTTRSFAKKATFKPISSTLKMKKKLNPTMKSGSGSTSKSTPQVEPTIVIEIDDDPTPIPPPNNLPNFMHARDLVQFRLFIRQMLATEGEVYTSTFMTEMNSPMPTADQIFKEELHASWIRNGYYHKLPRNSSGRVMVSVGLADDRLIRAEENAAAFPLPYPAATREVDFIDLSKE